ncbi:KfrB domain-containing protein [Paraburkholderia humisilvae]|uniref:KfrB domain-containing protein n=1 Tax=Paraburkholderia humisilvae TaxID=627669 RepID=A0A6J5DSB9_9BURK|nr:hypothetical protein [Paraburkholderia humisilvae]CAB3755805.1 hypothetical protein LMG29542_02699 [Paraburkholderia humisilvae]
MSSQTSNGAPTGKPRRSLARVNPQVKRQRLKPLDSDQNGVRIVFDVRGTYSVSFSYEPALAAQIRKIAGARFDRDADVWKVPVSQYDALLEAVVGMRSEYVLDGASRSDIERLVAALGAQGRGAVGVDSALLPRMSDYHPVGEALRGEIIAVNDRYAAQQLTRFDGRDGAAFVTLHRLAELGERVFRGDKVCIVYGEDGRATVSPMQTIGEKLDSSLGQSVDGVTVMREGDTYTISFDFNPVLSDLIQRVDGTSFDRERKVHVADANVKSLVARAVDDMRKEFIADRADREQMQSIVNGVDGAKVHDADVSDGKAYSGRVLAANGRYVLQHVGKDHVALHRVCNLGAVPKVGHRARIAYQNGRGRVSEPQPERSTCREIV